MLAWDHGKVFSLLLRPWGSTHPCGAHASYRAREYQPLARSTERRATLPVIIFDIRGESLYLPGARTNPAEHMADTQRWC